MSDTKQIRAYCDKATGGKWFIDSCSSSSCLIRTDESEICETFTEDYKSGEADAEFICKAQTDLPLLCDELDKANARVKELEQMNRWLINNANTLHEKLQNLTYSFDSRAEMEKLFWTQDQLDKMYKDAENLLGRFKPLPEAK